MSGLMHRGRRFWNRRFLMRRSAIVTSSKEQQSQHETDENEADNGSNVAERPCWGNREAMSTSGHHTFDSLLISSGSGGRFRETVSCSVTLSRCSLRVSRCRENYDGHLNGKWPDREFREHR